MDRRHFTQSTSLMAATAASIVAEAPPGQHWLEEASPYLVSYRCNLCVSYEPHHHL